MRAEPSPEEVFVFRKHDNVGAAAAEEDSQFLSECFVDTGDLPLLLDCSNPKRIVVGRTGAGKSALIQRLTQSHEKVIQLSPHDLSLNFIATNKVIAFYEEAGVNLAPFYVLLWKHLLVVELLKKRFNIVNETTHRDFMQRVSVLYKKDRYKEQALDYLQQWGKKFWLTTEERIHELTERVERSLSASAGGDFGGIKLSAEAARKLNSEQKKQVVEHGLDAVSKIQIRELDNMIELLAENVFDDPKDRYYVAIDMLDEDWADERIKFKLIKALVDVVRRFKAVPYVKVVLALRQDLLDKVMSQDPVAGFQEEKYKSLYLSLSWNKPDLMAVVERRIRQLIRRRYTKADVSFADVFVSNVDGKDTADYLLDRTFSRPRDIILFINECIALSAGKPSISAAVIKDAEERYSAERLQSLAYEWQSIYPNLGHSVRLFQGMRARFDVSEITESFLEERFNAIAADVSNTQVDPITRAICTLYGGTGNFNSVRNYMLREFYVTGLLGIKARPTDSISWSRLSGHPRLVAGDLRPSSLICLHPMFHRALGVRYSRSGQTSTGYVKPN